MVSAEHEAPGSEPPPFDVEGPESEWKERLPRAERIARDADHASTANPRPAYGQ